MPPKGLHEKNDKGDSGSFKGKAAKNKKDTLPMRPLMMHMRLTEINGGLVRMCLKQESGQTHFYYCMNMLSFISY